MSQYEADVIKLLTQIVEELRWIRVSLEERDRVQQEEKQDLLTGTELAFEKEVQRDTGMVFGWKLGHSVAKFQHVNKDQPNVHHDALEFPDGKRVLLTQLCEGQRATVLQLPACLTVTVDDAQRHHSCVE